jgi:predicted RNA binding protein YcfA (HicA-like mRNA interferase family)
MGRLAGFSYSEVASRLQAKGSHEIWRHAHDARKTTVPRHPGDIFEGTLRAVLRQAAVTPAAFLDA